MTDVKVSEFLGSDVNVDSRTGKFWAKVGASHITGKTLAEVQNGITAAVSTRAERVNTTVEVVQFNKPSRPTDSRYESRYRGPEYFGAITDFTINGVDVERGRGRGATTTVYFKTDRGQRAASGTFYRNNPEAREELKALTKEWEDSNLAYFNKALDILDKFVEVPSTDIYETLMNPPSDGQKLRVVS